MLECTIQCAFEWTDSQQYICRKKQKNEARFLTGLPFEGPEYSDFALSDLHDHGRDNRLKWSMSLVCSSHGHLFSNLIAVITLPSNSNAIGKGAETQRFSQVGEF